MFRQMMVTALVLMILVTAVACAPSGGEPAVPVESASGAINPAGSDSSAAADGTPSPDALAPAGDGQVVEVTPMSEAELSAQPTGQAPGGVGEEGGEDGGQGETPEPVTQYPDGWVIYTDDAYRFSVAHPVDFIVTQADTARLAGLIPPPAAAVYFMSPTTAESALAGTDAPDLEVRIHEAGAVASLADWLAVVGVGADQTITATTLNALPGVQVCASTMIFPPCSIFIAGNDRVYQLRALNQEGEMIAQSFALVP